MFDVFLSIFFTNAYYIYKYDRRHLHEEHECIDYLQFVENVCMDLITDGNNKIIKENADKIDIPTSYEVSI